MSDVGWAEMKFQFHLFLFVNATRKTRGPSSAITVLRHRRVNYSKFPSYYTV